MAPETCFITQGQIYEWYAQTYSDRIAALIIALSLDDAFHSWWFAPITAFLCVNLLMCSVLRFPQIRRRFRSQSHPEKMVARVQKYAVCLREREEEAWAQQQKGAVTDAYIELSSAQPSPEAGICHLGILMLIAGFVLHTSALVCRGIGAGRLPMTNQY